MNFTDPVVESRLNRVAVRLRWLRWLQCSAGLGAVLCLLFLTLGEAMASGYITNELTAVAVAGCLLLGGIVAWAVVLLIILASDPERRSLAGKMEVAHPNLLDRVNTLVALENAPKKQGLVSFYLRIERQAKEVLVAENPRPTYSATKAWTYLAGFLLMLALTGGYYWRFTPWQHLLDSKSITATAKPEELLTLPPPQSNANEQHRVWGEVRITEPGHDMKVTKVDAVPLQIEAASSRPLAKIVWLTAANGASELSHPLTAPTEPRFAAYQPIIYLDEYRLSEWDVLAYYARAETEKSEAAAPDAFASEIYFLEVRPFREDLERMRGGSGGDSNYEMLNELTGLINRQQHVIRQTHHALQQPQESAELQRQDRAKLSQAEADLRDAVKHLYAKIATDMENKPVGTVLDHLAQAEKWLERSSQSLLEEPLAEAEGHERTALRELVATRKDFQKYINENPGGAKGKPGEDEEARPVADMENRLKEMTEFRNESKASRDFVRKQLEQQRNIARRTATSPTRDYPARAQEEEELRKTLEKFQQEHPQAFQDVKKELEEAQRSLQDCADGLRKMARDARSRPQTAAGKLESLADAMDRKSAGQQLGDAYKLKKLLDKEIEQLEKVEKNPGAMPPDQLQKTANGAKETLDQLKKIAEQQPTRSAFGPQLRDSLNDEKKRELDSKLDGLAGAKSDQSKQQQAGEARKGMAQVSKAFNASQPQALQEAEQSDSLNGGTEEAMDRGMSALESLMRQLQNAHQLPPQDEAKLREEALRNLKAGVQSKYGENEETNKLLLLLKQELKEKGQPLTEVELQRLMDLLRTFSLEMQDKRGKKPEEATVNNLDPAKLPPAYRGRIERYFKKLSEK